jgi:peptide/nickel transport system permease protein
MTAYFLRRLALMLLVIFMAMTVNFFLPRAMPGDPVEQQLNQLASGGGQTGDLKATAAAMRARLGLDQPLWRQYLTYLGNSARLDLGVSIANYPEPVVDTIRAGLPWTVGLLGISTLISFSLGTLLGGLMAWPGAGRLIRLIGVPVIMVSAVPYFVLGVVLLAVLAIAWPIFPVGGGYPFSFLPRLDWQTASLIAYHGVLPALSIILASIGTWAIAMRGMVVGVLGEDYLAYGLRNALLPQVTHLALTLSHVVSGAILVEVIFAYPGIGYRLYQAIQSKDVFVIQGIVLLLSVSIAVTTFLLDLIYPLIDPRIRAGRS